MKVLIACEFSGIVREAFRANGHDALSCDLEPSETPGPHYRGNVIDLFAQEWDLMIAFPPCTHLSSSGARWWPRKREEQGKALDFVWSLFAAPIPRIALENPVGIISTVVNKPDQIIQPWQFGHDASKRTCLWLKGLPLLKPTREIRKARYANQTPSGQNNLPPSPHRAKDRSRTYPGIANAMAEQWGVR